MELGPLDLEIRRIVTDNDLDGVVTASILRRWWTEAEVIFGHPGELRAGFFDGVIDRWTAICDLPFHKDCGLCIDHCGMCTKRRAQSHRGRQGSWHSIRVSRT